jgi:hypothetical protein
VISIAIGTPWNLASASFPKLWMLSYSELFASNSVGLAFVKHCWAEKEPSRYAQWFPVLVVLVTADFFRCLSQDPSKRSGAIPGTVLTAGRDGAHFVGPDARTTLQGKANKETRSDREGASSGARMFHSLRQGVITRQRAGQSNKELPATRERQSRTRSSPRAACNGRSRVLI